MTLIVEDGTGLASAESYASVDDTDNYWIDRDDITWTSATTQKKEAALRKATDYLDAHYHFKGVVKSQSQALSWPRTDAYDPDGFEILGIPGAVKKAVMHLALDGLSSALSPNVTNGAVVRERSKVGDLETETEYRVDSQNPVLIYSYIDALLSGLTKSTASASVYSVKLAR